MSLNFTAAVLERLRGSAAAQAFGDTWNGQSGVQKFFSDYAGSPQEPYLVLKEPQRDRDEYMTPGADNARYYIASGILPIWIYHTDRDQAGILGRVAADALTDADLEWGGVTNLMYFRPGPSFFVPTPDTGIESPTVFVFVITMNYQYQGSI